MRWTGVLLLGFALAATAMAVQAEPPHDDGDGASHGRTLLDRLTYDELEEGRPNADEPAASWPNAQDPGPDLANFPNAAFTIPKGAFHFEFAPFSLYGPDNNSPKIFNTEYLFRYGVTDRVEFRLFGNGYESQFHGGRAKPSVSGFSPIAFDFKVNFWSQPDDVLWYPSMGMEAYLQSEFASPGFRMGTQPGVSLLFDHALPFGFQLEWNIGLNSTLARNDFDGVEFNMQWAFQRRFFEKLDVFAHGFVNSSALPREGDGVVVGGGAVYLLSKRVTLFGSYNAGLTLEAPTTFAQLGFALAF